MVKQEKRTAVGKVNANDPSWLLDKTLYHVLTDILSLELDDRHARWCHLLHAKDCDKWIRFEELNLSDFENMEYKSNGDIIKFTEQEIDGFKQLNEFIQYLERKTNLILQSWLLDTNHVKKLDKTKKIQFNKFTSRSQCETTISGLLLPV